MKEAESLGAVVAPEAPIPLEDKKKAMADVFGDEYADRFSDPVIFTRAIFRSPAAQQFYKREFPLVSRTLHLESVYRRRPHFTGEVLDNFAGLSAKKLDDILRMLNTHIERMHKVCRTNGGIEMADYLHPQEKVVPVIAAGSRMYLSVLEKLDEFYSLTGSATLNGLIDGNQRKAGELLCRKAVRAYSAMIRIESIRIRKEATRMYDALNAPKDEEMKGAESAHEQAVQTFDAAVEADAAIDPNSRIAPEQAADLISDITANAAAAAKRARKKPADGAAEPAAAGAEAGSASGAALPA